MVRLDHFRGLEAYGEVSADAETAAAGRWVVGPGVEFFEAVREALGGLPLVAEDLGVITQGLNDLRDRFHLSGMRVLQFGLEGTPSTEFDLPCTFVAHRIAYSGTHGNDTTVGWFRRKPGDAGEDALHEAQRAFARKLVGSAGDEVHRDVIRAALGSVADTVIIPMQDLLGLGEEARMNIPGQPAGYWSWRLRPGEMTPEVRDRLAELTAVSGRSSAIRSRRRSCLYACDFIRMSKGAASSIGLFVVKSPRGGTLRRGEAVVRSYIGRTRRWDNRPVCVGDPDRLGEGRQAQVSAMADGFLAPGTMRGRLAERRRVARDSSRLDRSTDRRMPPETNHETNAPAFCAGRVTHLM